MREINEAWQVLQDPVSRRRYDEGRLEGRRHTSASPTRPGMGSSRTPVGQRTDLDRTDDDDDLVDVLPPMTALTAGLMRHLPWVALVVVFGLIFVVSAYARAQDPSPTPSGRAAAGSCVDVRPGPATTIVDCSGPHDLQIVKRVVEPAACPTRSEPRRLGVDGLVDCVVPG